MIGFMKLGVQEKSEIDMSSYRRFTSFDSFVEMAEMIDINS